MRDKLVIAFAVLLVAGVVLGAGWVLTSRDEPDPAAEALAAAEQYRAAWEDWDVRTMQAQVRSAPEGFAAMHEQFVEAIAPEATRIELGEVTVQGSQADLDATVAVDLPRADTWEWTTHLTLQREAGEWAVVWAPTTLHPELRETRTFDLVVEEAARAPLLAHDGVALTSPGTVYEIGIEPQRVRDPEGLVAEFRAVLPEGVEPLERLLARDDLNPQWYYPVLTVREERFEQVWNRLRREPGVLRKTSEGRVGTDDGFALHLLGRVQPLSEEEAAERGPTYEAGDEVGVYGLEASFDDRLTGSPETLVVLRSAGGEVASTLHEYQGDPPEPVTTTLDADVQQAIENALVGIGEPAAIVAVDPATGGVRGSASRPVSGYNRAWEGRYPPGSTFKVVTATAALAGDLSADDLVACPGETSVGGLRLRNAGGLDLGEVTFEEAFARSCNTTFAQLAADLEEDALAGAASTYGFDASYELPLPAFTASFPEPSDLAERAAAAIGQGRVEASALHMATVAAAVASGTWRSPILEVDREPAATIPLDRGRAVALRQMMERVVADGTGTAAAVEGLEVSGKTGSAEFGTGDPIPTHAWFIGYVSGGKGAAADLAFAVLIEGGGSGGEDAAPLAGRFLRELDALAGRREREQADDAP